MPEQRTFVKEPNPRELRQIGTSLRASVFKPQGISTHIERL
jgi:hypothetical protein